MQIRDSGAETGRRRLGDQHRLFVAIFGAATPQIAYTASKGGVLAMTRELAVIHARENIRVNALCPVRCTPNC